MSIETQLGPGGQKTEFFRHRIIITIINRAAEELAVETMSKESTIIQKLINQMNLPDPLDASGNVNRLQDFLIFVRINVTNAV